MHLNKYEAHLIGCMLAETDLRNVARSESLTEEERMELGKFWLELRQRLQDFAKDGRPVKDARNPNRTDTPCFHEDGTPKTKHCIKQCVKK